MGGGESLRPMKLDQLIGFARKRAWGFVVVLTGSLHVDAGHGPSRGVMWPSWPSCGLPGHRLVVVNPVLCGLY